MPAADWGCLLPEHYTSPACLAAERTRVFEHHWHFAGFRDELREPGSFVTLRVGNQEVVVRRGEEGLVAFRNVCSHRHARILNHERGCGPLRCAYHGWTYDDRGYPVGLPGCRDDFELSAADRAALSLHRFAVETIGPLVFASAAPPEKSLRDWLGDFAPVVESWGAMYSLPFIRSQLCWSANWKTAVENTLEAFHAPFIHKDSLAEVIDTRVEFRWSCSHSSSFHQMKPSNQNWWRQMTSRAGIEPAAAQTDYFHYLIYPNVGIGWTYGALLNIQVFEPVDVDRCTVHNSILLPAQDGPARAMRLALEQMLGDFVHRIWNEDQAPVEACQRGYGEARQPCLLGHSESRVLAFQRAVQRDLQNPAGPPEPDAPTSTAVPCLPCERTT